MPVDGFSLMLVIKRLQKTRGTVTALPACDERRQERRCCSGKGMADQANGPGRYIRLHRRNRCRIRLNMAEMHLGLVALKNLLCHGRGSSV